MRYNCDSSDRSCVLYLITGAGDAHTEVSYKPTFLTDNELKHLILKVRIYENNNKCGLDIWFGVNSCNYDMWKRDSSRLYLIT